MDILVTDFFQHFRCHSVDFWLSLFLMNFSRHSFSYSIEDMLFPLATFKVFSLTLYFSGLTRVFPLRIPTPWIRFSLFLSCLGSWDSCLCETAFNNFGKLSTVKSLVLLPHFLLLPSLSDISLTFMLDHWCFLTSGTLLYSFSFSFFFKKIKLHAFVRNSTNGSGTIPPVVTSCRSTVKCHNQDNNINRIHWPYSEFLSFTCWTGMCVCMCSVECSLVTRVGLLCVPHRDQDTEQWA